MPPEAISLLEGTCLKSAAVQLEPDVLHALNSLSVFYHRQWWCYSHMYRFFKVRQVLLNWLALLVVTAGAIAGSTFANTICPNPKSCENEYLLLPVNPTDLVHRVEVYDVYQRTPNTLKYL